MPLDNEEVLGVLNRLLSAGPLDRLPKRRADLETLLALGSSCFAARRVYHEDVVNERLMAWLETFVVPGSIDHVSVRRLLVDLQYLLRDDAGTAYRLNSEKVAAQITDAARSIDLAALLVSLRAQRDERKRGRAGQQ